MTNFEKVKMLEFQQKGDDRGHLVIVEGIKDIPFDIKRVFYLYGSDPEVVRGQHANRESELCKAYLKHSSTSFYLLQKILLFLNFQANRKLSLKNLL